MIDAVHVVWVTAGLGCDGDTIAMTDIMRTVRSFDPCLPCGVHMMLGGGKVLELRHSPAFGAQVGGPP
jgi:hydrogenase large subunit